MQDNRETGWISRALASGSLKAIAYHFTLTVLLPVGIPIVTAYIGYLQGLPWMHILLGGGVMFAAMTTGLVRLDDWLNRRRVKDKLNFSQMRFGRNIHGSGIFLGFTLVSRASVPIELEVLEVRTRVNNRVPAKTAFNSTRLTVPPEGVAWFDDHVIDIGQPPKPGTLEGFGEFKIKYGRPGALKHDLTIKKQVVFAFDAAGLLERGSWQDAN